MTTPRSLAARIILLGLPACALAQDASVVTLAPGAPALERPGVPLLWAETPDADVAARHLSLTPATPYRWVVSPGEEFVLTAASTEAGDCTLTVWDWERRAIAQRVFTGPFSQTLRFAIAGRGTYLVTLDQMDGATCRARLARSFAVCPSNLERREAWRSSGFLPGCCSFPGRQHWENDYGPAHPPDLTEQEARELDAELSARLGMVLVRPDLPVTWPAADQPMDFTRADASLAAFTTRGFRLALQVSRPGSADWSILPAYAGVSDPKWRYPCTEAATRQYVAAVLARYGGDAEFIEVYNEPDNLDFWRGTVEEFIATHHWVAEEAHKACPGTPVITGGLCLLEPERTGLIVRGVRDAVDAVGYHSHGDVDALKAVLTAMRAIHAAAGYEPPVFCNTEMGYANWRLDMERASAATAVQKLIYCWAHGNRAALLYCSRDIGGPRMSAKDWGYLDFFFCPRFTYGAVAAFLDHFAGARLERILEERNGLYAYAFRRSDSLLVPVFVGRDYPRPVTIATDAQAAKLLDAMGNASAIEVTGGKIKLTAGYYPTTLVLEGARQVELE